MSDQPEACPICGAVDTHTHREESDRGGTVIRNGVSTTDPDNPWGALQSSADQAAWLLAHGTVIDEDSPRAHTVGAPWPLEGPDGVTTIYVGGSRPVDDGRLWVFFRQEPAS